MDRTNDLLLVTERLYAAAASPELWPSAVECAVDALRGSHAFLHAAGGADANGVVDAHARVDERVLAAVSSPQAIRTTESFFRVVPFGVSTRAAVIADRDFERTEYYNEAIRPLNGFYALTARQENSAGAIVFNVCRPFSAEDFGDSEVATMRSLLPHLSTALDLGRRMRAAEGLSADLVQLFDRLATGVILTDVSARPVMANARAERIIADADGLRVDAFGLAATTATATRQLRDAIGAMSSGAVVEAKRLRLDRPSQRRPLLLTVLPIWRLGGMMSGLSHSQVAIFITEPDAPPAIDRLAVAEAFRLTRRESEIAALLAGGLDLETIASQLALGRGTVRDHLKHVFEKTGARSQATLVALLRGFVDRLQ